MSFSVGTVSLGVDRRCTRSSANSLDFASHNISDRFAFSGLAGSTQIPDHAESARKFASNSTSRRRRSLNMEVFRSKEFSNVHL